jgi:hypothetical protein
MAQADIAQTSRNVPLMTPAGAGKRLQRHDNARSNPIGEKTGFLRRQTQMAQSPERRPVPTARI